MKQKILIMIIAVIFLLSAAGSLFILFSPSKDTVRIISDGRVIETVDLRTAEDREIITEYQGRTNTVTIRDGEIFVSDAECFDHTCMRMGALKSASLPIVCLPNHLVIEFVDETEASAADAVTR